MSINVVMHSHSDDAMFSRLFSSSCPSGLFQSVPVRQVRVNSSSYCLRKHSPTGKKSQIRCWYMPQTYDSCDRLHA